MSCEETPEDHQNNELEALKSIYEGAITDLRKKAAWNQWQPLHIMLTLTPLQGSSGLKEVNTKVDLKIICPKEYPNKIPKILLENASGISNSKLEELQGQLKKLSEDLVGEVMIFQLAEHVKAFLHQNHKPPCKSFYDEMLLGQKKREQLEREREEKENNRKKQVIIDEVQVRQDILKSATKKFREERLNSENSNESVEAFRKRRTSSNQRRNDSSIELSDEVLCGHDKIEVLEFTNNGHKIIHRGRCLCHSERNCIIFSGLDQENGQLYKVTKWSLTNSDQARRNISSIEQEINYFVKLKHHNLSHYLNIKHDCEEDVITIYILQEFVIGINCRNLYLETNISVEYDMLKHLAEGVLSAIEFLHRNNIIHRNLSASCVYINRNGTIKLTNYSLDKRLFDLVSQNPSITYNKKTDIFQFGLLMLSLIKKETVSETNPEIPTLTSVELQDFINKCISKSEGDRPTAAMLLSHPFLKEPPNKIEEKENELNSSPEAQVGYLKSFAKRDQSRVQNEFQLLEHLGNGAYGDVFKVQNNLDQGFYALKRIALNPKSKQLNKKIFREVKLLSRLNHENVVRYFYSWIESGTLPNQGEASTSSSHATPSPAPPTPANKKRVLFPGDDSLERLAPKIGDVEWSSFDPPRNDSSDSEESSGDEDDPNWDLMENEDSYIEFDHGNGSGDTDASKSIDVIDDKQDMDTVDSSSVPGRVMFMYIQMEFCEKSTLRTAIDGDLYLDKDRTWRLFREIAEGLSHIHQQGMIHRDLKPMNIFLDYNDHVKIGDFGLATTSMIAKQSEPHPYNRSYNDNDGGGGDPSMTGHIGTALYVAPELTSTAKACYNQKVDIYSLGIILFEMCYKPLTTGMERIVMLNRLRTKEAVFPSDFLQIGTANQEKVIRWLLDYNVTTRPTSKELLQSDLLPPPVLEECELRELVRHTLQNPQLKGYKYLIESCFKQPVTPAQDITYDKDMPQPNTWKNLQVYGHIKGIITKVFKIHGGQNLNTPLLMPKSKYYDGVDTCVNLMTHSGSVTCIPHDLRIPFARYVAWNGITSFRRYSIERVYREKKVFGFIPRELCECAFDIVTSTPGNFMADAEVLSVLNEIVGSISGFRNKNLLIRLNHTLLIKAILLHCGVKEDNHQELYNILTDWKERKGTKLKVKAYLIEKGLSDNAIQWLGGYLDHENNIKKTASYLQSITQRNNVVGQCAKVALHELKSIVHNAEALGVTYNIVIAPGLVFNVQQYSGMMCQLVCPTKRKHKHGMDVLAAGGRYDNMISYYRNGLGQANMLSKDVKQSAVGISISLDKLVQGLEKDMEGCDSNKFAYLDVAVCSLGSNSMLKEKAKILRELWSVGIRCNLIEASTIEDISEQCNELKVPHVIILKDTEHGMVKVRSWERDRFQERKFAVNELVENMQKIIKSWNEGNSEQGNALNTLLRSESKGSHDRSNSEHNQEANVSIYFQTIEKLPVSSRKRFENQIRSQLDGVFKKLCGDVTLFALSLDGAVVKTISSFLEFDSDQLFNKSVETVKEKHVRHKKYLNEICDKLYEQKSQRTNLVIILYSLIDGVYKVMF